MDSLIATPTIFCVYRKPISHLTPGFVPLVLNTKKQPQIRQKATGFNLFASRGSNFFGFFEVGSGKRKGNLGCCWCKARLESEEDTELEAELLEFMDKSSKPGVFPSKKELVEAGRLDLVEAIKKRGGWFLLGWESEDEENDSDRVEENDISSIDFDIKDCQRRVESCEESGSLGANDAESRSSSSAGTRNSSSRNSSASSFQSASSSGGTLEIEAEEESGIEGILSRLEKERSSSFGFDSVKSGHGTHVSRNDDHGHYGHFKPTRDAENWNDHEKHSRLTSGSPNEDKLSDLDGNNSHYTKPDMWRTWSLQRAGFNGAEFEAAEISYDVYQMETRGESSNDKIIPMAADATNVFERWKGSNHNQIRMRLQHLEMELASTLRQLTSRSEERNSEEVLGSSSNDLQTLSDALEFQQNEFMTSQERLRSIRAKLAVIEGKMALALMDAENILEEKQKRIDSASRTLHLLRTTCVVWPNSASVVCLAGSFDGWTTQRKMQKSSTGIFSAYLKLYPGKYEIKFIVDGVWKIDPLRPIVHNNGHENNLLIIT